MGNSKEDSSLLAAQTKGMEVRTAEIVTRAEKLKGLRGLLRSPELQAYLLASSQQSKQPFLTITDSGTFKKGYSSYERGKFTPAMVFYFNQKTGHTHVLIPQSGDGIVYLQDRPDPAQTEHGLVSMRALKSAYWRTYQQAGFRLYDPTELEAPREKPRLWHKLLGSNVDDLLLQTAGQRIRFAYEFADDDSRPVLTRFVDGNGETHFRNLAADNMIELLDPFDMQIITNGIAQSIASGK